MRRREFITFLGGAAAAWPVAARSQQQNRTSVIAVLTNASFQGYEERLRQFRQGLAEAGYVPDRNVTIEYHEAGGDERRLSALANELVRRRVSVIVTNGVATQAAQAATSTIPILFSTGADPVEMGVVASLNRPGGNLTGITALGDSLGPKRLELLHEVAPTVTDVGALFNPGNGSNEFQLRDLSMGARTLGLQLHVVNASTEQDFEAAFAALARLKVGGLVVATAPIFNNYAETLGSLSVRHAIPAFYQYRDFVAGGGLMSIGSDQTVLYHQLGLYAGRILNGEKPADLPVQQATKIELVINLKTAKALGITVPITLLGRADEVIEP